MGDWRGQIPETPPARAPKKSRTPLLPLNGRTVLNFPAPVAASVTSDVLFTLPNGVQPRIGTIRVFEIEITHADAGVVTLSQFTIDRREVGGAFDQIYLRFFPLSEPPVVLSFPVPLIFPIG